MLLFPSFSLDDQPYDEPIYFLTFKGSSLMVDLSKGMILIFHGLFLGCHNILSLMAA
jgi:hypothetical protein